MAGAAVCLFIGNAQAHHGFGGRYDTREPQWLDGVVTAAQWAPPHPTLTVRIDTAARVPTDLALPAELTGALSVTPAGEWTIEFPPVGTFFELRSQLKVGDRVTLIALRNCQPPRQLRSQWIRLSGGSVVSRSGRLSYMVDGCAAGSASR